MTTSTILTIVGPEYDGALLLQVEYSAELAESMGRYLAIVVLFDDQLEHYGHVDPLATGNDKETFIKYVRSNNIASLLKVIETIKKEVGNRHKLPHKIIEAAVSRERDVINAVARQYDIELTVIPKRRLKTTFICRKRVIPAWMWDLSPRLLLFEQ